MPLQDRGVALSLTDMSPKPYSPTQERLLSMNLKIMTVANNGVYRLTGGRIGGRMGKAPVCLLTTTGRKSGQPRTVPLLYLENGNDIVVVASKGGMSTHPAWYLNLVDNPQVTIQIGKTITKMVARTATPEEKPALWERLATMYKGYNNYQARTEREIPVVICSPVTD